MKLLVTGDIHIGKKYDRYPEIKDKLIQSRFDCVDRIVKRAENEACDFLVITGDLFDNISSIRPQDVKTVVDIISTFNGRVLVLPGNHDYYTGEEKVWKDFKNAVSKQDGNVILLTEMKPYSFDLTDDESVTFYPAFCQAKHSRENNLDWIRNAEMDSSTYHVGIAHGAVEGQTPDMKNEYFLMTEKELNSIPVDAWLIGHTHVPFPKDLKTDKDTAGYKIFNAGTPEQTDLSNNTAGYCFVLTLDKQAGKTTVSAHSYESGKIRFFDLPVSVGKEGLRAVLHQAVDGAPVESVVRLTVSGVVSETDYKDRYSFYDEALKPFLAYEIEDGQLCEMISKEKIRSEFAEIGFAAELLERLEDAKEKQWAYDLIKRHQN